MRCFISISRKVTNKHLSIVQIFVISFTVIYTPFIMVFKVIDLFFKILMVILIGAIMGNSFLYLFYLVFCYMKDSKLGPQAMMLLKDQLKSAKIHFALFMLHFTVCTVSLIMYLLSGDQMWRFLILSIYYSSAGALLFSMSLLVGYAVQVTQVSIKSRKKLYT
jgi:hypothetical protein